MTDYRRLSYWMSTVDDRLTPRPRLAGDVEVDVAIVGAGYTGLWTAYYLAVERPGLRVAVIEAEIAGYGASGRNGGWCSALFPTSVPALARRYGRDRAVALHQAMVSTVDEVGRAARAEAIDCHYRKGGTVVLARSPAQLTRARAEVAESAEYGLGVELLDGPEAARRCGATGVLGGTYTPDCAAIHPARLVRGLASAVERRGVRIYEGTRALALRPGSVATATGTVRATTVVRATEGYTPALPGLRREIAPVYSLMIATEPLPPELWESIGLAERETFSDHRHMIIYGQRTVDGRLAFGGRGAPYHFGSRTRPAYDRDPRVFAALRRTLVELFPALGSVDVAYAWGGPLGVARDWTASVGYDRRTGLAWAGGYVGDGVGTANLAGRTLADLILDRDSDLVRLPWVGHRSPRWQPEPLRWLGANVGLRLMGAADAAEARTGRPSRTAAVVGRLLGQ
ncbi:NAD(P)/FAD-dependent oxidoreductase [Rugosimonospora africana]|uniref:FAD-dependent oxidoreductase n=1 Tax=Rugosimonospora africana TaxID=556532 RepID=A0A8J3VN42_9ACTN|nr:FAD-dependent oxidoreductase [Rugosimonospora africana]GIH12026.1 FAD-dependent oxidoreductase [Rugosimonospora africana]